MENRISTACRLLLCVFLFSRVALADRKEPPPKELEEVGITENLNAQIPRELPFVDSEGHPVTLGQFLDGKRPVLLTINYSSCAMLCGLQLNGLFEALQALRWDIGTEFQVVTVSMDPRETTQRAAETKAKYLRRYGRPGGAEGWHWLTGQQENIKALADRVGFHYRYVPQTGQYAHPAVLMVCTPDGRVSRYLKTIQYDPQTLRLSLVEAGQGKIGSTLDGVLLYCFKYDAAAGRYAPAAMQIMKIGSLTMVVLLGALLGFFWARERRRSRRVRTETVS
jgi:protein SCO1/2